MSESSESTNWQQPEPGWPSPDVVFSNERAQKRKEQGLDICYDGRVDTNAWNELTLDQRKTYERGQYQEDYEAAIADFNAQIPLSPSVSGSSDDDDGCDVEDGSVTDRRAIQRWNRYRRDWSKEVPGKSALGSRVSFPFLRLPVEIRRIVYAVLVKRSGCIIQQDPNGSGKEPGGPIELRLAMASKQLFTEVMTSLFGENTIYLEPSHGLPILFDPKAASAPFWPMNSMKRIQLLFGFPGKEWSNFINAELEKLVIGLQQCEMAEIQIMAYSRKSFESYGLPESYDKDLDEAFDRVLARLEPLRGVKRLVFEDDLNAWPRSPGGSEYRSIGTKEYRERLQSLVTRSPVLQIDN
ncbi:MAG: hypothetical protein Q9222_002550 [Ikaeria aurantiellina]